jgi:hypothetical protein
MCTVVDIIFKHFPGGLLAVKHFPKKILQATLQLVWFNNKAIKGSWVKMLETVLYV